MRVWMAAFLAMMVMQTPNSRPTPWLPDNGDGTFHNPVIYADYSDPDVIRAGRYFYMVSSSFVSTPALPILRSPDLVNWRIVGHVSDNLPARVFETPQHGKGVWAPSLREHAGRFYVYYGDPDLGIFMSSAPTPEGPWEPLFLGADKDGMVLDEATALVGTQGPVDLRVEVAEGGVCRFSLSTDGKTFHEIGNTFTAQKGAWVGARIGLFATGAPGRTEAGYVDVDWFRIDKLN